MCYEAARRAHEHLKGGIELNGLWTGTTSHSGLSEKMRSSVMVFYLISRPPLFRAGPSGAAQSWSTFEFKLEDEILKG